MGKKEVVKKLASKKIGKKLPRGEATANPKHREDFNWLLSVAAPSVKASGKT